MKDQSITPMDPYSEADLYKSGIFVLMNQIDVFTMKETIEFVLRQNTEKKKQKRLQMLVCSDGGDMNAAFALIDIMKASAIDIHTVGLGVIASAGLLIFMSGTVGHRVLTPNTSILSHQWSWGAWGKEHELFAQMKEYQLTTDRMINHYNKCTGLDEEKIRKYLLPPEDVWLGAKEAKKLGICDSVKTIY